MIEDKLPEKFLTASYHPSLFIYAWKRNLLDKLFEEFLAANIAVLGGEAWLVEGENFFGVIPVKDGSRDVLSWKIGKNEGEEWYDFVDRSVKESLKIITDKDIELKVSNKVKKKIYYHFDLAGEDS